MHGCSSSLFSTSPHFSSSIPYYFTSINGISIQLASFPASWSLRLLAFPQRTHILLALHYTVVVAKAPTVILYWCLPSSRGRTSLAWLGSPPNQCAFSTAPTSHSGLSRPLVLPFLLAGILVNCPHRLASYLVSLASSLSMLGAHTLVSLASSLSLCSARLHHYLLFGSCIP